MSDFQDFLDGVWVETDGGNDITVDRPRVQVTAMPQTVTGYVQKPWTIGAGVDFTHRFVFNMQVLDPGGFFMPWMVAERTGDLKDMIDVSATMSIMRAIDSGTKDLDIVIYEAGAVEGFDRVAPAMTVPYTVYIDVILDADGGAFGNGRKTIPIYDDPNQTSLYDTLVSDNKVETIASFASNLYAFSGYDDGNAPDVTGFVDCLDLDPDTAGGGGTLIDGGLVH